MNSRARIAPSRPSYVHPAVVTPITNEPVREAAREELGPDVAAEIPTQERELPQPVEPGAAALVESIANTLRNRVVDEDGVTRIAIGLRNQSRCGANEFTSMRERLAQELNRAANDGRGTSLRFIVEPDNGAAGDGGGTSRAHYVIQGSAYLINAGGFDLWELFLSMTPTSERLTVWEPSHPVRVLRTPRAGQPQIVSW